MALIRREKSDAVTEEKISAAKESYIRDYSADIREIITEPVEISSSEIRTRILSSRDIKNLVPAKVYDYIAANHLYGINAAGGQK